MGSQLEQGGFIMAAVAQHAIGSVLDQPEIVELRQLD